MLPWLRRIGWDRTGFGHCSSVNAAIVLVTAFRELVFLCSLRVYALDYRLILIWHDHQLEQIIAPCYGFILILWWCIISEETPIEFRVCLIYGIRRAIVEISFSW
jgi:hypothetical protein